MRDLKDTSLKLRLRRLEEANPPDPLAWLWRMTREERKARIVELLAKIPAEGFPEETERRREIRTMVRQLVAHGTLDVATIPEAWR